MAPWCGATSSSRDGRRTVRCPQAPRACARSPPPIRDSNGFVVRLRGRGRTSPSGSLHCSRSMLSAPQKSLIELPRTSTIANGAHSAVERIGWPHVAWQRGRPAPWSSAACWKLESPDRAAQPKGNARKANGTTFAPSAPIAPTAPLSSLLCRRRRAGRRARARLPVGTAAASRAPPVQLRAQDHDDVPPVLPRVAHRSVPVVLASRNAISSAQTSPNAAARPPTSALSPSAWSERFPLSASRRRRRTWTAARPCPKSRGLNQDEQKHTDKDHQAAPPAQPPRWVRSQARGTGARRASFSRMRERAAPTSRGLRSYGRRQARIFCICAAVFAFEPLIDLSLRTCRFLRLLRAPSWRVFL